MKNKINKMSSATVLLLCSTLGFASEYEDSIFWSDDSSKTLSAQQNDQADKMTSNLKHFRVLQSTTDVLKNVLEQAPERSSGEYGVLVDLPLPNNKFVRFRLFKDSVMQPELAKKFPMLQTWWGYDESNPSNHGRFDFTEHGFHGMFVYNGEQIFIDPLKASGKNSYINYRKKDASPSSPFTDEILKTPELEQPLKNNQQLRLQSTESGEQLRVYRLAVATTGEYTQFHGGTVSGGLSAVVTTINRVNSVYEVDFSIRLQLVANNDQLIYTNANTDPYTNGRADINTNTGNLNSVVGSSNYDVGHLFQTSGGGLAGLGVVCNSRRKGAAYTGLSQPVGDPFHIDYVAHELGHQFRAQHTFNGSTRNCRGRNRSASAAYEPGSGSTIMGYAGICGAENLQDNSNPYFHTHSITEVNAFVRTGGGNQCGAVSTTGNTAPVADAGKNYTIPANTPFTLKGSATDNNAGDPALLTYTWEQYDLGAASSSPSTMVDNGNRPIFRSFNPSTDTARTFPLLKDILNNTSTLGMSLPTTNRDLNFRLTVRDTKGGVSIDDMVVTVSKTGQTFAINTPAKGAAVTAEQPLTVKWNVAGTNASPVNCSSVDVSYSNNNGENFTTVASNLSNNGNGNITIPNTETNNARIKVSCSDNIFFAISNAFTVR